MRQQIIDPGGRLRGQPDERMQPTPAAALQVPGVTIPAMVVPKESEPPASTRQPARINAQRR